jgi:hypothetical protein
MLERRKQLSAVWSYERHLGIPEVIVLGKVSYLRLLQLARDGIYEARRID